MISNVMEVQFEHLRTIITQQMYREDAEQYLKFTDIELPEHYTVDFGRSETGNSISMIGDENGVLIPDEMFTTAGNIHAWIWVNTGEYGGKTCYHAIIPVNPRGKKTDIQPTPAERQQIEVLVEKLDEAVKDAEESANEAAASAKAIEDMTVSSHGLEAGSEPTVEKTEVEGVVNLNFGIPRSGVTEAELQAVVTDIKAGTQETADYHLGFYLDENGDLCQVDN